MSVRTALPLTITATSKLKVGSAHFAFSYSYDKGGVSKNLITIKTQSLICSFNIL